MACTRPTTPEELTEIEQRLKPPGALTIPCKLHITKVRGNTTEPINKTLTHNSAHIIGICPPDNGSSHQINFFSV